MPIISMTVKEGCRDEQITACMKTITSAIADNLERTLPRMVRVTVTEVPEQYCLQGSETPDDPMVTIHFDIGPGRSEESVQRTMGAIVAAVRESFDIPEESIRLYIIMTPNEHFTIAGKVK